MESITLADCGYELQYEVKRGGVIFLAFKYDDIDQLKVKEFASYIGYITKDKILSAPYSYVDTIENIQLLHKEIKKLGNRL